MDIWALKRISRTSVAHARGKHRPEHELQPRLGQHPAREGRRCRRDITDLVGGTLAVPTLGRRKVHPKWRHSYTSWAAKGRRRPSTRSSPFPRRTPSEYH